MAEHKLAMLVLSCDGYSDLWDDFFNLREKYWADCPYKWYVVTESKDYQRDGVEVIKCGKEMNWAGRFRHAVQIIDAKFYGIFLEDYFISDRVENNIIEDLLDTMQNDNVTFINVSDVFMGGINMENKTYHKDHLIVIPNHRRYGLNTESAIWEKEFLLKKIGDKDYSAWQFEMDRVSEAETEEGLGGYNLIDDRMPFHVSIVPVVIQGKVYPPSRKFFESRGYAFKTQRADMPIKQVLLYKLKRQFADIKHGRAIVKWMASKFLGMKFFTK